MKKLLLLCHSLYILILQNFNKSSFSTNNPKKINMVTTTAPAKDELNKHQDRNFIYVPF